MLDLTFRMSLSFRYQIVMQTTTEESRKAGDNLNRLLEVITTHVVSIEVR